MRAKGYMIKGKLQTSLLVSVLVFLLPLVSVLLFAITRSLRREESTEQGTQIVYDFQGPGRTNDKAYFNYSYTMVSAFLGFKNK